MGLFERDGFKIMMQSRKNRQIKFPKVAIIIITYNNLNLTKDCLNSIRVNNTPEAYQIIVVDNASSDGSVEWLREQKDIFLIANEENKGFPYACNQGIAAADTDADIFLLNNDTIVPKNALHWLQMGLYSDEKVGAVGSVSNNVVNYQQVPERFDSLEEWMEYAEKNNVEMEHPYEKKSWLVGFAMLIKRTAINTILEHEGKLNDELPEVLDTRFSPGNYEDNDLSIRLLENGYQLLLCKNSFIYHHGGMSFGKQREKYSRILLENQKKLADKYGMDLIPYSYVESALLDLLQPIKQNFSLLQVECGLGSSLARIESRYPNSDVHGIEKNPKLANLAKQVADVQQADFLKISIEGNPGYDRKYDYVLLDRVLERDCAQEFLVRAAACIKQDGIMLISVDNRQCVREIENGFTLDEIVNLFNRCHLQLGEFHYRPLTCSADERKKLEKIMRGMDSSQRPLYEAERFIFSAQKG